MNNALQRLAQDIGESLVQELQSNGSVEGTADDSIGSFFYNAWSVRW